MVRDNPRALYKEGLSAQGTERCLRKGWKGLEEHSAKFKRSTDPSLLHDVFRRSFQNFPP